LPRALVKPKLVSKGEERNRGLALLRKGGERGSAALTRAGGVVLWRGGRKRHLPPFLAGGRRKGEVFALEERFLLEVELGERAPGVERKATIMHFSPRKKREKRGDGLRGGESGRRLGDAIRGRGQKKSLRDKRIRVAGSLGGEEILLAFAGKGGVPPAREGTPKQSII